MAVQTVWVCSTPFDVNGACPTGNELQIQVDNDLATALITHSTALDNNRLAMEDFFTLSADDVALISASMFAIFLIGWSTGRVAKMMRN
jgi:hypothetical protein